MMILNLAAASAQSASTVGSGRWMKEMRMGRLFTSASPASPRPKPPHGTNTPSNEKQAANEPDGASHIEGRGGALQALCPIFKKKGAEGHVAGLLEAIQSSGGEGGAVSVGAARNAYAGCRVFFS
jgi:hypothetical protein